MIASLARAMTSGLALLVAGATGPWFDQRRAFEDLSEIAALPADRDRSIELVSSRLRQAGWVASHDASSQFQTIVARKAGARGDRIVLATHVDGKIGANCSASGAATLLEVARALGGEGSQSDVYLVFFDAHEPEGHEITPTDGLRGSKALAKQWEAEGVLPKIRAFIVVDQVADKELELHPGGESWPPLVRLAAPIARDVGVRMDPKKLYRFPNDHTPFRERGVRPILTVIDHEFGGTPAPGPLWHSAQDNLDAVSAESLGRAGEFVLRLVRAIDKAKDTDLRPRARPR